MMEENSCLSSGGCTIQLVKSMEQGQDWPSPGEHRLVSSMGPEGGQTDVVRSANSLWYSQASGSSVCQSTDILPGPKERNSPGIKKGLHTIAAVQKSTEDFLAQVQDRKKVPLSPARPLGQEGNQLGNSICFSQIILTFFYFQMLSALISGQRKLALQCQDPWQHFWGSH